MQVPIAEELRRKLIDIRHPPSTTAFFHPQVSCELQRHRAHPAWLLGTTFPLRASVCSESLYPTPLKQAGLEPHEISGHKRLCQPQTRNAALSVLRTVPARRGEAISLPKALQRYLFERKRVKSMVTSCKKEHRK